ncbi:MAG: hypothetical protein ACREM6_02510 [Vulcanimicrobiaceae bacterium]
MNDKHAETTQSYLDIAGGTYALWIDAFAAANGRALSYVKALTEITTRPPSASTVETGLRDGFERANQIVNLTVGELQTTGRANSELAERVIAQSTKLQETFAHAMRGAVSAGLSNIAYVKETADAQLEGLTKRVEELQARTAATVSQN